MDGEEKKKFTRVFRVDEGIEHRFYTYTERQQLFWSQGIKPDLKIICFLTLLPLAETLPN